MKRRANSPYLSVDIAGRVRVNVYRTAQHRHDGLNPVVQRINESGRFDTMRGVFLHLGHVGALVAICGDGPARKRKARAETAEAQ